MSTVDEDLQALIDLSVATAGEAVGQSVGYGPRQMKAAELIEFWRGVRLVAMATVGKRGQPHIAPVHASLSGRTMRLVIYDNSLRRLDIAANPRVAFTAWNAEGAAAILCGRARELAGSLRAARPAANGRARQVVEIEVELTRVYAMRAPTAG